MKVAYIQNRVQLGGRFQVTFEMTKVLNAMGIVPDFYCYRHRLTLADIEAHYGAPIKLNFKPIKEPKLPFEWNITRFNSDVNKHIRGYDLIINSNNTSLGLDPSLNCISYVHYPRKARLMGGISLAKLIDIGRDPMQLNALRYHWHRTVGPQDVQIANSAFTAARFEQYYDTAVSGILYPPVDIHFKEREKVGRRIVSLGRFSSNKRQLEQIEMMANLREYELYLIGFKNDVEYFNRCEKTIKELKLTNVHLVADASEEERNTLLTSAAFFIHSLREEPFGITTVQGIGAGCIPIVHNSGGQKEVVPFEELRYENEAAIPDLVRALEKSDRVGELRTTLQKHIAAYDSASFRDQFSELLEQKLPKV